MIAEILQIDFMAASILDVLGSPCVLSIVGCRLMIHLKEAGPKEAMGRNTNVSSSTSSHSFPRAEERLDDLAQRLKTFERCSVDYEPI